jgi:type I restriction enzyme, S subunit
VIIGEKLLKNDLQDLNNVSTLFCDGDWVESKDQDPSGNVRLIQLADVGDGSFVNKSNRFMSLETAKRLNCTFLLKGDILIARMPDPLGRCCIFPFNEEERYVTVVDIAVLRLKSDYDNSYVKHLINMPQVRHSISLQTTGTTRTRITRKKLQKLQVPLPPQPEQQKIAAILDAADSLRQKDQQLIDHYTALSQSLFLDMFGDPVSNPMGWGDCSLAEHGKFKNGLNFKKGESGFRVKYLGVGAFKSHSKIDDIDSLDFIDLNNSPSEDYFLKDGDVVFVRSNGSGKLVGRCVVMYPSDVKVTYSGFCIRYRVKDACINVTYLTQLFREKSFRKLLLQSGQGANIQNINQKLLSALDIPLPPISLQKKFAERIESIEQQKQQAQASLKKSEDLFNSLLQRAFKGELTRDMAA